MQDPAGGVPVAVGSGGGDMKEVIVGVWLMLVGWFLLAVLFSF